MKTALIIVVPFLLFLGFGQDAKEALPDLSNQASSQSHQHSGSFELGGGRTVPQVLKGKAFSY